MVQTAPSLARYLPLNSLQQLLRRALIAPCVNGSATMMYTLDLSGHGDDGRPGVERMGGLFPSIESAEAQGRRTAETGRLPFKPATVWVRDQENLVVKQVAL